MNDAEQYLLVSISRDDLVRCKTTGKVMLVLHTTASLAHCAWSEDLHSRAGIYPLEQLEWIGRQSSEAAVPEQ